MKIYDCFTFFNELDLLEIRLEELSPYVDYFVLVEARQTHKGARKKLFYEENKERYKKFHDKIIHIVVDLPNPNIIDKLFRLLSQRGVKIAARLALSLGRGNWRLERFQRKSIRKGLKNCKDSDIIIVSDLDEIPDHTKFKKAISFATKGDLVGFDQKMYIYYLNGDIHNTAVSTSICSFKTLKNKCGGNPQFLRIPPFLRRLQNKILKKKSLSGNNWHAGYKIIREGGWHFSYLGGAEKVIYKNKNYAHAERLSEKGAKDIKKVQEAIDKGKHKDFKIDYIEIDETFPKVIYKNQKKYKHLIKEIK